MLMFDATEVRSTCDKNCKFHNTYYSKERVFLHSNNCIRRWTNEGLIKRTVTTESVSPSLGNDRKVRSTTRQPLGQVTIDSFNHLCKNCQGPARAGYMYCSQCWR